jgi:predicted outer membrane protein
MISHPLFTLLAAVLLAAGLAMAEDRTPRERLYAAARVFAGCAVAVGGGGWVMHWIHG